MHYVCAIFGARLGSARLGSGPLEQTSVLFVHCVTRLYEVAIRVPGSGFQEFIRKSLYT